MTDERPDLTRSMEIPLPPTDTESAGEAPLPPAAPDPDSWEPQAPPNPPAGRVEAGLLGAVRQAGRWRGQPEWTRHVPSTLFVWVAGQWIFGVILGFCLVGCLCGGFVPHDADASYRALEARRLPLLAGATSIALLARLLMGSAGYEVRRARTAAKAIGAAGVALLGILGGWLLYGTGGPLFPIWIEYTVVWPAMAAAVIAFVLLLAGSQPYQDI